MTKIRNKIRLFFTGISFVLVSISFPVAIAQDASQNSQGNTSGRSP